MQNSHKKWSRHPKFVARQQVWSVSNGLKKDHKKWIDFPRNPVQNVHLLNTQHFDFSNQFLPSAEIDTVKKAILDRNRKYMIFLPQFNSRLTILQFFRPFKLFTIIKKHHVGSYCLIIILFWRDLTKMITYDFGYHPIFRVRCKLILLF